MSYERGYVLSTFLAHSVLALMGASVSAHSDFISAFRAFDLALAAAKDRGKAFRFVKPHREVATPLVGSAGFRTPQQGGAVDGECWRRAGLRYNCALPCTSLVTGGVAVTERA